MLVPKCKTRRSVPSLIFLLGNPLKGLLEVVTFDAILSPIFSITRVNDTLDDVEVELTLLVGFALHHVLFECFGVILSVSVVVHVDRDRSFEVIIELAIAFVGGGILVCLPCGVVVSLVLPFDL